MNYQIMKIIMWWEFWYLYDETKKTFYKITDFSVNDYFIKSMYYKSIYAKPEVWKLHFAVLLGKLSHDGVVTLYLKYYFQLFTILIQLSFIRHRNKF